MSHKLYIQMAEKNVGPIARSFRKPPRHMESRRIMVGGAAAR